MTKTMKITCDTCGQQCGGPPHLWWYIELNTVMDGCTGFSPPFEYIDSDFCSIECVTTFLEGIKSNGG